MNPKLTPALLVLGLLATVQTARAESISLIVTPPVTVGKPFDAAVQATDVFAGRDPLDALLAYGFNVTVGDTSIVQYLGETPGPLFDDLLLGTPMVSGTAKSLLGLGPGDFIEPLTLAILHFNALRIGTTNIGVTWDSSDLNQGLVYLDLPYGPIDASTRVTATPEPATMLLVAPALGLLSAVRRRKRRP
jgi:hypothetical protein